MTLHNPCFYPMWFQRFCKIDKVTGRRNGKKNGNYEWGFRDKALGLSVGDGIKHGSIKVS